MTRVRRIGKRRRDTELPNGVRAFLETGVVPPDGDDMQTFALRRTAAAWWQEWGEEILEDFVADHPGRRPWAWWKFSAPEPRRRLGGVGTPAHEVLAYAPELAYGIPVHWVQPWQVEYYSGHAVDIHGQPIGTEFRGHEFHGVAIDASDPPTYESQAAFLDRHALLTTAERARLTADAFEPERVLALDDEEPDERPTSKSEEE